jgi:TolB protein
MMMKRSNVLARSVFGVLFALGGIFAPAYAALEIDLTKGVVQPIPIAISDFLGAPATSRRRPMWRALCAATSNVRASSRPSIRAHIERSIHLFPAGDWRDQAKANHRQATRLSDGQRKSTSVCGTFSEQQMISMNQTTPENWRRLNPPTRSMSA